VRTQDFSLVFFTNIVLDFSLDFSILVLSPSTMTDISR